MRRTYASKKATGGGLDHKDLVHTVDERSSVFDAYYIRNIKQTKRELSCMGSSNQLGAISTKVRKRKYVKRIVKDIEPIEPIPRESISRSAFLTPDKSIHVRKELDPFDMLLNSTMANIDGPEQSIHVQTGVDSFDMLLKSSPADKKKLEANSDNLFKSIQPRLRKQRSRRKITKAKKYSYSSEDSTDSNKENSTNDRRNTTSNTSNIMSHKFVIEKVNNQGPKHLDESINNIVKNMSLLSNYRKTSEGLGTSFKFRRNRLTASNQSPILQRSPLCSTPFKAKYRGESIFKFSPINLKGEDSPCFVTVTEENYSVDSNPDKAIENGAKSPITHLAKTSGKTLIEVIKENELDNLLPNSNNKTKTSQTYKPLDDLSLSIQSNNKGTSKNNTDSTEISALQTTEIEPFLGFSINNDEVKSITIDESRNDTIIENIENDNTIFEEHVIHNNSDDRNLNQPEAHHYESSKNKDDFDPIIKEHYVGENLPKQRESDEIGELFDIQSFNNDTDSETGGNVTNKSDNISIGIETETYDVSSLNSQDHEGQSLYNTCSSDSSSEDKQFFVGEPIVIAERMNDSLFLKYYQNYSKCYDDDDDENESSIKSDDYTSLTGESDDSTKSFIDPVDISKSNEPSSIEDSGSEDRCISFVTTRRRNELTNNSMLSLFNEISNSTDCENTILSNNIGETTLEKSGLNQDILCNVSLELGKQEDIQEPMEPDKYDNLISSEMGTSYKLDESIRLNNPEISAIATNSSKFINDCTKSPENSANTSDFKPPIVLRPGKKWERSLSIYRRMTMMTDHFDQSILEEEPMDTKGRNYRQSVISTMELQEFKGPLHNESINNRRSTFVSKPNRSAIRILKDPDNSRISLCTTAVFDDLKGFLTDECDDTLIELSKLSIADAGSEVTVLDLHDTSTNRITTARDYVLRRCNQTEAINFDECYPDAVLKNCHKIGEGVYGEVFLWRARDGRARVMKIVPVAGDVKVNGEHQKDFHEIISEIVIAMELSALRTPIAEIDRHLDEGKDVDAVDLHTIQNATDVFNEVLAIRCVYGSYPSRLLDLWDLYDECKGSENDNPAILPPDQQFIVLELANAGLDLESYQFNNAEQAHALFLQVALALAVGEEAYQFEHRDLHWGNVLIAPSDQKWATFVIRGRSLRAARCGVAATIIDYSLSRLAAPLLGAERAALYNDLSADDSLFDAVGDYQFQVYRLMRDKLRNDWKNFEPYTNILWLHYTLDKMITALRYKRTNTKIHKHYIEKLKAIKNRILEYGSSVQFVLTDNEF